MTEEILTELVISELLNLAGITAKISDDIEQTDDWFGVSVFSQGKTLISTDVGKQKMTYFVNIQIISRVVATEIPADELEKHISTIKNAIENPELPEGVSGWGDIIPVLDGIGLFHILPGCSIQKTTETEKKKITIEFKIAVSI